MSPVLILQVCVCLLLSVTQLRVLRSQQKAGPFPSAEWLMKDPELCPVWVFVGERRRPRAPALVGSGVRVPLLFLPGVSVFRELPEARPPHRPHSAAHFVELGLGGWGVSRSWQGTASGRLTCPGEEPLSWSPASEHGAGALSARRPSDHSGRPSASCLSAGTICFGSRFSTSGAIKGGAQLTWAEWQSLPGPFIYLNFCLPSGDTCALSRRAPGLT